MKEQKNQCQGCQAGWPFRIGAFGDICHIVQGGYKGEICICTKNMYETKEKTVTKHNKKTTEGRLRMLSNYKNRGDEMNDRELLELAALAYNANNPSWFEEPFESFRKGFLSNWNPIEDDGDALRLAVKLCLLSEHDVMYAPCNVWEGEDQYAATRRAIVRSAAEIGRNMK